MTTIQFNNGYAKIHAAHTHVYTEGEFPVVTYYTAESRWAPFSVERGADHRQITSISSEDAAAMVGAPEAFIRQVEAAAKKAHLDAKRANDARIEAARCAWRSMSQSERNAINDYAMQTEGHTID